MGVSDILQSTTRGGEGGGGLAEYYVILFWAELKVC